MELVALKKATNMDTVDMVYPIVSKTEFSFDMKWG